MSELESGFFIDGDDIRLHLPFTKVDKERRTVSGFATLDNRDAHKDEISADATRKAFQRWVGNVREMHQPVAVGKVLDFTEKPLYDPNTDRTYLGMFVTTYVSKGAEDTWQKVLDGTLKGFSIGGKALRKQVLTDDITGEPYRRIDEYELIELSLVDNPANPLARVLSIQKLDDGFIKYSGIAVDADPENVMYCKPCKGVVVTKKEEVECNEHGEMTNIGWVEGEDDEMVKTLIQKFEGESHEQLETGWSINSNGDAETNDGEFGKSAALSVGDSIKIELGNGVEFTFPADLIKGGVEMAKEEVNDSANEEVEEVEEVEDDSAEGVVDSDVVDGDDDDEVEKAADVSEVEDEEVDTDDLVQKIVGEIRPLVEKAQQDSSEEVEKAQDAFDKALESVKEELTNSLESFEKELKQVKKQVKSIEDGSALKKSVEVEDSDDDDDDEEESFWNGRFLGSDDLVKA